MTGLRISKTVSLDATFATKATAILAQRRKGKSYCADVIAEECVEEKIPFVILDPTGAHWGLRSSADGKKPGLPVVIFGGQHGDLPLERGAGRFVADLVLDHPGYYVVDLSLFESKQAEREFITDFAERLYRRKGQPGMDFVLLVIVDEADMFIPQRHDQGDNRMVGAFEAIVRRGGIRGLGVLLISQRAAVLNKNVLEMIDILIVLRTVGPNDQRAIDSYIGAYADAAERDTVMGSLASLDIGEAWIYEPGGQLLKRVQIRERRTFNSGATPKAGERRTEPTRLAEVDLAEIKEAMASTIAKAEADDPKVLRRRIGALEKELAAGRLEVVSERIVETVEVPVEVPVISDDTLQRLEGLLQPHAALLSEVQEMLCDHRAAAINAQAQRTPIRTPVRTEPVPQSHSPRSQPPTRRTPERAPSGDVSKITGGAARMVTVLARQYPGTLTRPQLATMAKLKRTGGTFSTYWSRVTTAGLVEERGGQISATEAGLKFAGVDEPNPMTAAEMRDMWVERFTGGARRMLELLLDAWPAAIDKDDLADAAGITKTGGTFSTYLSRLRSNGLIELNGGPIRASDSLFPGGTP